MKPPIQHLLIIKAIPPSLNVFMRQHWFKRSKELDKWKWLVAEAWGGKPMIPGKIKIKYVYYFPSKRKKDIDNFFFKGIGDALKGKVISEDNYTVLTELTVRFEYDKLNPRTEILIEEI